MLEFNIHAHIANLGNHMICLWIMRIVITMWDFVIFSVEQLWKKIRRCLDFWLNTMGAGMGISWSRPSPPSLSMEESIDQSMLNVASPTSPLSYQHLIIFTFFHWHHRHVSRQKLLNIKQCIGLQVVCAARNTLNFIPHQTRPDCHCSRAASGKWIWWRSQGWTWWTGWRWTSLQCERLSRGIQPENWLSADSYQGCHSHTGWSRKTMLVQVLSFKLFEEILICLTNSFWRSCECDSSPLCVSPGRD